MSPEFEVICGLFNFISYYLRLFYRKVNVNPIEAAPKLCDTIFGKAFDHKIPIDNTEEIAMPDSSVSLIFPKCMLDEDPVRLHFSSHTDIQAVTEKLNLAENQFLVSAVPEFKLDGCDRLKDYVCVKMPFIDGAEYIIVRQYNSLDGSSGAVSSKDVPLKGTNGKELNTYYEIKNGCVNIYTKSFSGFYVCGICGRRELKLYASCYGSYRRVNKQLQISTAVYITDALILLPDYKKRIDDQEKNMNPLMPPHPLRLPRGDLTKDDEMMLGLTRDSDVHVWTPKMNPGNNTPIEPDSATLQLDELIIQCSEPTCSAHAIQQLTATPQKRWHLTNKEGCVPSDTFQGIVGVHICKVAQDEQERINENTNILVELNLEESDRLPKQEDVTNLRMCVAVQETNGGN